MQTAIGGRGTLFGPLVGATVWLFLQDFLQAALGLGAAWKLVLGIVFVLLVCFLRRGIIGGLEDLYGWIFGKRAKHRRAGRSDGRARQPRCELPTEAAATPSRRRWRRRRADAPASYSGPILQASGLTKRYGGLLANSDIDFTVNRGELRGIIGPNGAGKSTFFKMLTCEIPPTSGKIVFDGRDITGMNVTERLSARPDQELPGQPAVHRPDGPRKHRHRRACRTARKIQARSVPQPGQHSRAERTGGAHARSGQSRRRGRIRRCRSLPMAKSGGSKSDLALATSPSLLLLDEPLAGMSPRERVETVKLLKSISRGRTMIIIDHDMDALFELAERVTVLQEGRVLVEGTPEEIKNNRDGAGSLSRRRAWSARGMNLLEANGLNSYYGDSHILFDVSLRVARNEVVGLLGRNGAGKSTTLKSLMGVLTPRTGKVMLDGANIAGPKKPRHRPGGHAARA